MAESVVTRIASVFLVALLLQTRTIAQIPTPPLIVGIDHIPVVVSNLEKAQADFRRIGFSIKLGRPHADGIRNAHVKFPDGTEIELITAPAAVDALTTEYRAKIKMGDGPVYFGLYAPDRTALAVKLRMGGFDVHDDDNSTLTFPSASPLHPLFFGGRNKSPTDKPEYFAHENSAVRLSALWVRDDRELRKLFRDLGMPLTPVHQCAPISKSGSSAATLPEGNVYLVPSASANVVVARVEVRSLATLESVLKNNRVMIARRIACDPRAIWISPKIAHGIWLEFVGPH
jgi:hypothetical protein